MIARATLLALALLALGCGKRERPEVPSGHVDKSSQGRRAYLCLYDDDGSIRCAALQVLRDESIQTK